MPEEDVFLWTDIFYNFKWFLCQKVKLKRDEGQTLQMNSSWSHEHLKSEAVDLPSWCHKSDLLSHVHEPKYHMFKTSQIRKDSMELLNYLIVFVMLLNDGFLLKTNGKKFGVRGTQSVPNLICFCMSSWPWLFNRCF